MAKEYIIHGFYPNFSEYRAEVVANSLDDAMILAQGALKVTTLKATFLIDARNGELLAHFGDRLVIPSSQTRTNAIR